MSRHIVNTDLRGYEGPIFVSLIGRLRRALEQTNIVIDFLKIVAGKIPGFEKAIIHPQTEDKYVWFCGLVFRIPGVGEMIILIPRQEDKAKTEGSSFDRSIVVYAKGNITIHEIHDIIEVFAEAYENFLHIHTSSKGVSAN
ncbi:MAG: hypothetical protein AAB432_02175 [Patescibacteria group bacterium]